MASGDTNQVPASPQPSPQSPSHKIQFYRRLLPETCISFSSPEGKKVFTEALQAGYMDGYFGLAAQFRTQDEPAYCGLSTLVMVLNTLEVDPKRVWKGVWRWYHEDMLDCCVSLEHASKKGITLEEFACIASCNTLNVNMMRVTPESSSEEFRSMVKNLTQSTEEVAVVSYSRKILGQTGDGHFSPIGGYHPDRDLVLILDTARFKYPPHWVSLPLLFQAMKACDKDTGMPRGYLRLRRSDMVPLILFRWDSSISLPMLDPEKSSSEGISEFLRVWNGWLGTPAPEDTADLTQTAVSVMVEALGFLNDSENILTTQVNIECLEAISPEHDCNIRELLHCIEGLPFYKAVEDYIKETPDISSRITEDIVRPVTCRNTQTLENEKKISSTCKCKIMLQGAHMITMLLLVWPMESCGNTVGSQLRKVQKGQTAFAKPVLQDEVSQLSRQLSTLMQYQEKCCDCHCQK